MAITYSPSPTVTPIVETTQMEAELLRLVGDAPDDPAVKKRIGRLFLAAASPQNAKKMFEAVVRKNRKDAEAWAGLGDAEFGLKHYLSASSAYRWALRYRPDDLQSRSQLELARGVINLDPTRRGLGSATRLRISRQLVARALSAQEYCLPEDLEECLVFSRHFPCIAPHSVIVRIETVGEGSPCRHTNG